ncbi:hypothetical protein H9X85_09755 [Anaerotignum lactatifermentans]|uniref:Uncharacterized protein n=1 Tax=Anaerotignum lactatifermentans TaxID=160404 RepID=A0ABS2GA11_9FIRM|nr:hypothetical protein [Anaerotignum lactatifermentans]MBM6830293.1 hypothetical protein [Anaerotignum lactatifermentans]MBM6878331.1 hypothetical protein [Anaerotignum lactatifermentans]MBM6951486.1 hypothetical protein [Anaerotignum lactatifermentans]
MGKDIRGPLAKTKSCPQGTSSLMSLTEKEGFEQAIQQNFASVYDGLTLRCCAAKAE